MRSLSLVHALLASITMHATPSPASSASAVHASLVASSAAEVYRLAIIGVNGMSSQRVDIILEQGQIGIAGWVLTDTFSAALEEARLEDGTLHATVMTSTGRGALVFHPFLDHPYGTLTVGTHTLPIREVSGR